MNFFIYVLGYAYLQLNIVAYDDAVPEDRVETKISVYVRRNENGPRFPTNPGPVVIPSEAPLGHIVITINGTDSDGVSSVSLIGIKYGIKNKFCALSLTVMVLRYRYI